METSITGYERNLEEAARVLAAVSCFFVLTKGMSVVGPRPALPAEVKTYPAYQRQRLLMRGGITGLALVNGGYDLIPAEKVLFDFCEAGAPSGAFSARMARSPREGQRSPFPGG